MVAADIAAIPETPRRRDFERWRRRSRLVRRMRVVLPVVIGLILSAMAGVIIFRSINGVAARAQDSDAPIRLVNPRFVGRDEKGRGFVVTAVTATRDEHDYQRVILDRPALVLDERGSDPMRITARSGVYHEGRRSLDMNGGVRLTGQQAAFDTMTSRFDTKTGELVGAGPIQGSGRLGEINAKSYGVYDKGERMVFKGGVRARIDGN
ncbi:MAG: LPS export ABC transporter periplasmic protein LptC [Phenylobacterium sp.]|uniref:LPS export ABC transporter periplasmic protein LptC n=1 Tax=Phenylobacterium sp. TaxID=1871053 RepID=UPI002736F333|nr:LPS export ABC transporter periplasmic protein LptC [Phenylobacterium sp.]MDP3173389.1 LPS export ABC transporter periplasmic protein LptC [Phenylobacterium sp.]